MLTTSKGIQPSNGTDAAFRLWAKFLYDGLIAGGWVQTADTGQINFGTVTKPTTINEARGYVILRMDDDLQADVPVFMRLDFGSGGAAANPGLWISLGPGSDGAGAIASPWLSNPTSGLPLLSTGSNSTSLTQPFSMVSADVNRAQFSLANATDGGANYTIGFSLERSKDGAGGDTAAGLLLLYTSSGVFSRSLYMALAEETSTGVFTARSLPQPALEVGVAAILPQANPGTTSEEWGVGVPFPFFGLPQQPGVGLLIAGSSDVASPHGRFGVDVYGTRVTYQVLHGTRAGGFGHDSTSLVLLRAD